MFAVLNLERDPLKLSDIFRLESFDALLASGFFSWLRVVGTIAALGLLVWVIVRIVRGDHPPARPWLPAALNTLLALAALGYVSLLVVRFPDILNAFSGEESAPDPGRALWVRSFLTFGATCALLAVSLPFFVNLSDNRWRRVWAIARISFKEAVRGRVPYVFAFLIFLLLFVNWFVQSKPENQLQTFVEIVYSILTPLVVLSAGLLGAFAIPTDIKQQTIHTVTTKPVERFEIVVGRFLGYSLLMTLMLFAVATLSLLYVLRGINPAAAEESLKARVPVYGELDFFKVDAEYTEREATVRTSPENVGREWDYRKYIVGQSEDRPREPVMYAVWSFKDLPKKLGDRDFVRCEFNFDIYRMNKGQENRGVQCSFFFETRNYATPDPAKRRANQLLYQETRRKLGAGVELTPAVDNGVSEEFGYFEVQGKKIEDYHTLSIDIPAGLIRNALKATDGASSDAPLLKVRVRCGSPGQMVGMARYDLYFRADDPTAGRDTFAFILNFYKGTLGLWMILVLIMALCVALSTQLGGIISFLCVMLLFTGGEFRDFIQELTRGSAGGGAAESAYRLFTRANLSAPLEESTLTKVATSLDDVNRFLMQGLLYVLPDTDRYYFTERVANGFDVALVSQDLLPTLLMLLGYLYPWALLSFYLIRNREIAGAT